MNNKDDNTITLYGMLSPQFRTFENQETSSLRNLFKITQHVSGRIRILTSLFGPRDYILSLLCHLVSPTPWPLICCQVSVYISLPHRSLPCPSQSESGAPQMCISVRLNDFLIIAGTVLAFSRSSTSNWINHSVKLSALFLPSVEHCFSLGCPPLTGWPQRPNYM